MKMEGLLPIGSVVMLKGGEHRVMIMGYAQQLEGEDGKVYDYVACLWPEGFLRPDQNILFDGDQIDMLYSVGYITEGQQVFAARMEAALAGYREKMPEE